MKGSSYANVKLPARCLNRDKAIRAIALKRQLTGEFAIRYDNGDPSKVDRSIFKTERELREEMCNFSPNGWVTLFE